MNRLSDKSRVYYILSVILPIILLCFIFCIKHITPFGSNTLLSGDMLGQYTNFYTELCNKIKNGNSLFFSWNRGLGIDYLSECSYYNLSFANIIYIFFDNKTMPTAISISVIIKCALAALTMYTYLEHHYKKYLSQTYNNISFVVLSCCYAMCSYFINYLTNIIWLDAFLIFPLVMLTLELLIQNKKPYLYTLALSACILSNFYIGYMICLFCVIYFIYLIFTGEYICCIKKRTTILKIFLRFSFYSLLSGLLCSFVLIPTINVITSTDSGTLSFYKSISTYYSFIESFFRQMMSANPTYWHHPYIYSTVLSFLIIPFFFVNTSIPLKQRIGKGFIYFFMLISFQINILDFIWNGFHRVNCFAGRQSFVFIFLVITIIADTYVTRFPSTKSLVIIYLLDICLFSLINIHFDFSSTFYSIIKNTIYITIYFIIMLLLNSKKHTKSAKLLLIVTLVFELSFSASDNIMSASNYNDYKKNIHNTETALLSIQDTSFYRIKNAAKIIKNNAALCNYNGLSTYSSLTNNNLSDFLYRIGFTTCLNAFDDLSWEPVFSSILGTKYIIDINKYTNADNLELIYTQNALTYSKNITDVNIDKINVYKNIYSLNPAFVVNNSVKKLDLNTSKNPFELVNEFANCITNCGKIYEPVPITDNKIISGKGEQLYLYSKQKFGNLVFQYTDGVEPLYSDNFSGITLTRTEYTDDYIYYVHSSPEGGYISIPDDNTVNNQKNSNTKIYDTNDYIAYKLNYNNYTRLMSALSKNQIKLTSYSDTELNGTLNADYDGTVMTSIPYSKGWTVKIDGKKVKTSSISDALLSFNITKGNHNIEMSYFPQGFTLGLIISITALIILIASGIARRY